MGTTYDIISSIVLGVFLLIISIPIILIAFDRPSNLESKLLDKAVRKRDSGASLKRKGSQPIPSKAS